MQFLDADSKNHLIAVISGKRYREVGLFAPVEYKALTKNKKMAKVLGQELQTRRLKLCMGVNHELLECTK